VFSKFNKLGRISLKVQNHKSNSQTLKPVSTPVMKGISGIPECNVDTQYRNDIPEHERLMKSSSQIRKSQEKKQVLLPSIKIKLQREHTIT
jgi:hypothetical protein